MFLEPRARQEPSELYIMTFKMYPTSPVHLWCRDQNTQENGRVARRFESARMSGRRQSGQESSEAMESLEKSSEKKITKLKYYMKPADEL